MRILILPLLCCLAVPAAAQVIPPRDPGAQPKTGTGVIQGKVTTIEGRPLRRAQVSLATIGLGADGRKSISTGADGAYTFKDLPAGRFRITVTRGGYLDLQYGQRRPGEQGRPLQLADGQRLERIDFALPRLSGITGRVTDEHGEPMEGVYVYAARSLFYDGRRRLVPVSSLSVRSDDEGEYKITRLAPGAYYVVATTRETWPVIQNGQEVVLGYMPTYFPGMTSAAQAQRVAVKIGEYVRAIDFSLVPGRTARISGIALDSQGKPFTRVSLGEEVRGLSGASFRGGINVTVQPDGSFSASNVPPGEYTLSASRFGGTVEGPPEVALMPLTVEGQDIENIVLTGSTGGTVTGRVVAEEGPLPKVSDISVRIYEQYRSQPPPVLLGAFNLDDSGVKEDGRFTVPHVFGRARVSVSLPEGWMLKRVTHEGRDITDKVLELRSGEQVSGIEVVISNRVTELAGQVVDEKAQPVGDAAVLVFPADADAWFEHSTLIRLTRPDQQGRWQLKGLRAGEYLAVALEYIEDVAWRDPEYLESLREFAAKLKVEDGGSHLLPLKLTVPK